MVELVTDVNEVNQEGLRAVLKWWVEKQFDLIVGWTANEEWNKGLSISMTKNYWNLGVILKKILDFFFLLFVVSFHLF